MPHKIDQTDINTGLLRARRLRSQAFHDSLANVGAGLKIILHLSARRSADRR